MSPVVSSLIAFLTAAVRPTTPLAKAIVLVLVIKVVGIAGMKLLMFPNSAQPIVDAATMEHVIRPSAYLPQ
jgi:hypothetical protein